MVKLAEIVKIEVNHHTRLELEETIWRLRDYRVQMLAEKIETHEQFETCRDLGFTYFQGNFLCKPNTISSRRSPTSRLPLLRLLAELNNGEADFGQLASLISQDVSLTYKLLRIVNSPIYALCREFKYLKEALQYLGLKPLRRWASVLLLAGIDDKPRELVTIALLRANMCERMATAMGHRNSEAFFLVGLFSVLDALLDSAMPDLLKWLPLNSDVNDALLSKSGEHGRILSCVLDYERGDWVRLNDSGLEASVVTQAYYHALEASAEIRKVFAGA